MRTWSFTPLKGEVGGNEIFFLCPFLRKVLPYRSHCLELLHEGCWGVMPSPDEPMAVNALNSMRFGRHGRRKVSEVDNIGDLPAAQQEALRNVLDKVKQLGCPPADASRQGALNALRAASSSYMETEPCVGTVVDMVMEQLSLPSGEVGGVSLVDNLDENVRAMVEDFESHMLQDASRWTDLESEAGSVPPYNDKLLSHRDGYLSFLKRLFSANVLDFSSMVRGRVGALCVAKKPKIVDGVSKPPQRLVLDCRQTNLLFRAPPLTNLGSLPAVGQLKLKPHQKLYTAGADIRDCFYAVTARQE